MVAWAVGDSESPSQRVPGLGRRLWEDDEGLKFKARITDTPFGRDCLAYIRDGVVNTMSIGYETIKQEIEGDLWDGGIRRLKEIKLFDAQQSGIVDALLDKFGGYSLATVVRTYINTGQPGTEFWVSVHIR